MTNITTKKLLQSLTSPAAVRIRVCLLLLASATVILIGQVGRELLPPDDLREAEVAREMYANGDYVVPHLAGLPFVEKPSGFPAVVSTAFMIVGKPSAGAARVTAAAFALASLAAVFFLGRFILGIEGGALAATLLAFSQRFCRTAHEVLLDNALTAAIAFTVLFVWIAVEADRPGKKRLFYGAAGFSLGVSFLFKGWVGPVLFGSGFFLYLIVSRRFSELRYIFRPFPIIAFLFPVLSWTIPFLLRVPADLIGQFFIANHFGRFMSGYLSNKRPIFFYLVDIWPAFAPASIFLPLAIWKAWKTRRERENRAGIFLLSLSIGPLVPLSASVAKDSIYFLPVHPALAMLVAWSMVKGWTSPGCSARMAAWIAAMGAIVAAACMLVITGMHGGATLSVAGATIVFVLGTAGCLHSIRRQDHHWAAACIAVLVAMGWCLWFSGPMARADVKRCSMHRPMMEALGWVGNRDILLYRPTDGLRGAASFYRNRTAREIKSPETLVNYLTENSNNVLAMLYSVVRDRLPPELRKAAKALDKDLRIEACFEVGNKYLMLVSARPLGLGVKVGPEWWYGSSDPKDNFLSEKRASVTHAFR